MQAKKRIIATAIAALVLGGAGSRLVLAQTTTPDVRQEDRRADRREDRQQDRQQAAGQQGVQVELPVPTNPAGMIDTTAVLATVQTQVAQGTREIQFRGVAPADLQTLALSSSNPAQSVLAQIAALMPSDGVERSVTLRGAGNSRVRVQRADNGSLRARVENVAGLSPDQLAQIRQQLAALGFSRIDLRGARSSAAPGTGTTASGNSGPGRSVARNGSGRGRDHAEDNDVRREDRREDRRRGATTTASAMPTAGADARREDRVAERAAGDVRREDRAAERAAGDVRQEDRAAERAAGDVRREDRRADRPVMPDRRGGDRVARTDRPDRMDRPERAERIDRPERVDRPERPERPEGGGGRGPH